MIPAQQLNPDQLIQLALQILHRCQRLAQASKHFKVSRKFLYSIEGKAFQALDQCFSKSDRPQPLFWPPVAKPWIKQFTLALIFNSGSGYRGIIKNLYLVS